uniref:Uncharacterized protein n=1 Tax=Tanacetum cinerariifolium TaxID=118510 RepID=A0A6L2L3X9_TANCI|nr:hypothetical protein [Tanacetum cinerariifolium]
MEGMDNPGEIFEAKISVRSKLQCLQKIKFHVKELSADNPPILFKIANHDLHFGREEFCLVIGFRCGEVSQLVTDKIFFLDRVFRKKNKKQQKQVNVKELWTVNVVKNHAEKKEPKKMTTYNLNGFVWAQKDPILNLVLVLTFEELKADWWVRNQYYFNRVDALFIQSIKPKAIDFQRCESEVVDYFLAEEEFFLRLENVPVDVVKKHDGLLVQQGKAPPCSTVVQADTKVIDSLTTAAESVVEHVGVAQAEVFNCDMNLVECPVVDKDVRVVQGEVVNFEMNLVDCLVVEKDVGVVQGEVVNYEMNLVDCPVVEKDVSDLKNTQPSLLDHLINACANVNPPLPLYDTLRDNNFGETSQVNNDLDDYMDIKNDPSKYCLDNMTIGIEEDTRSGELTLSLYEEPKKDAAKSLQVK